MSGKIHFVSGKTLDITEKEFQAISPKLGMKGIKCHKSQEGHLIPMNSTTMEFIEHIEEKEEELEEVIEEETKAVITTAEFEEYKEDALKTMIDKSNCKHENQTLHIQHTAKGIRYFPVCDFCGKRERYVSEKKILDGEYEEWKAEDIENAKPWTE